MAKMPSYPGVEYGAAALVVFAVEFSFETFKAPPALGGRPSTIVKAASKMRTAMSIALEALSIISPILSFC